jgi:hypothetical protein
MTQKLVDGVLVDLTPEEQADYDDRLANPPPSIEPPPPSETDLARLEALKLDSDLQDIVQRLANNDVSAIKNYLATAITDLPTAKAVLIKTILVIAYLIQKNREFS